MCKKIEGLCFYKIIEKNGEIIIVDVKEQFRNDEVFEIPKGVAKIQDEGFSKCPNIKSVVIPNSLKYITDEAFYNCEKLNSIYYNGTIEDYCKMMINGSDCVPNGYSSNPLFYILDENGDVEFNGKNYKLVEELVIPNCIKEIRCYDFWPICSTKKVVITNGVERIDDYAFFAFSDMDNITIPESIKIISFDAFNDCTCLKDVYYYGTEDQWNAIDIKDGNELLLKANLHFVKE